MSIGPLPGSFDDLVDMVDSQAVFDLVAGASTRNGVNPVNLVHPFPYA
jgi:hypothetical protein